MRVCFLRHAYFPDDPRDRKQIFALSRRGHEVDVVCLRRSGQKLVESMGNIRVWRLPFAHRRTGLVRYFLEYAFSFVLMAVMCTSIFIVKRCRVIQANSMPDFLVFATLFPWLMGARVLLDLHEPTPELWTSRYGTPPEGLAVRVLARIEQRSISFADHVITVTETIRQRFISRGASARKLTVVRNVCDDCFDRPLEAEPARDHPDDAFVLITHGLIAERYGHESLVRAVGMLCKEMPDLHLDIPGDGDFAPRLRDIISGRDLDDHVHLHGFVSEARLRSLLARADVGVICMYRTPYSELIDTNKMYEYIALHKPVIAARLPGVEATFDDTCVSFFTPGDIEELATRIRELRADRIKGKALADNAYRQYETIRWSQAQHNYTHLLERLALSWP